jgi:hypothetical protein
VFIALGVIWFLVKLVGRLGGRWKLKTLVACCTIAVFVLFPTWDLPLAQRQFERLCQTEAGLKMNKSVENVPGVHSSTLAGKGVAENFIHRHGYEYFEHRDVLNKLTRYVLNDQGHIIEQAIEQPASRYRLEIEYTSLDYVNKKEMFIEDVQTTEKLASHVAFTPRGGWLSQRLRWSYGDYACEPQQISIGEFLTQTIKPSRRQHKGASHADHS